MNESAAQENTTSAFSEGTPDSTHTSGTLPGQIPDSRESEAELLTTFEAATLAGVDSRTIRRWFAGGKIRGKLDGHKLLVHGDDVQKLSGTQQEVFENFAPDSPGQPPDMTRTEVVDVDVSGSDRDALIEKMMNQLVGAAGRVSWLECELEQHKKELRLLPDLQAKATELEQAMTENEALKKHIEEIELQLARERSNWWARFRSWVAGRSE